MLRFLTLVHHIHDIYISYLVFLTHNIERQEKKQNKYVNIYVQFISYARKAQNC